MPAIVIHEMGCQATSLLLQKDPCTIGRDPGNEVVLHHVSVSRQHAVIRRAGPARFSIQALNPANPLIINGKLAGMEAGLAEGDEIQVGRYLLIFSLEAYIRKVYMKTVAQVEGRCQKCSWQGVVKCLVHEPRCSRCGSTDFKSLEQLDALEVASASTCYLAPDEIQRLHSKLHEAKRARIERVVEILNAVNVYQLGEDRVCTIGRDPASMSTQGFAIGGPASVRWERSRYIVRKGGFWPKLKVNGQVVVEASLKEGDIIELGGNRFRFVVGEAGIKA